MKERDRGPVLEPREIAFVENRAFRDNSAFGVRIVEFPTLVVRWVTNKDAPLHMRVKRTTLVLLNMYIGQTAPNG